MSNQEQQIRVRSTVHPDRVNHSFNEWQEDMKFERELDIMLENIKYKLKQEFLQMYYQNKNR